MTVLDRYLAGDPLRLVDVGARTGIAPRWKRLESVLDVTGFEPDPVECERLNRAVASLAYPARFLPVALWSEPCGALPFHVTNWPVASSIRKPNAEFLRSFPATEGLLDVREVRSISATTLDDVASREGLAADCLKVDVEGAALDVLRGADSVLRDALVLEVEAELNPLFEGEPLFPEVDSHVRARGWVLEGLRRTSWRRGTKLEPSASGLGGQIVSVDALYLNRELIDRGLDLVRELKLLAILSAYLQADALLVRLRSSRQIAAELSPNEIAELERLLAPGPGPISRVAQRALTGLDAARRRALADRLQPGDAGVWEDPHFF